MQIYKHVQVAVCDIEDWVDTLDELSEWRVSAIAAYINWVSALGWTPVSHTTFYGPTLGYHVSIILVGEDYLGSPYPDDRFKPQRGSKIMKGLGIGRIVHYVAPVGVRPGIITKIVNSEDGTVGLFVFPDANDPPGIPYDPQIGDPGVAKYSPDGEPFTWHWPPRV